MKTNQPVLVELIARLEQITGNRSRFEKLSYLCSALFPTRRAMLADTFVRAFFMLANLGFVPPCRELMLRLPCRCRATGQYETFLFNF